MRISFKLDPVRANTPAANPSIFYDHENNRLVFHHAKGGFTKVDLDAYDFTLHEKCEMPAAPLELAIGEIGEFDGVYLSPKTLVQIIDAAREV